MMEQWLTALREGADELHIALTAEQEERFGRYLTLLLERNQQVNLTAITDPVDVAVKHFVDSLTVETIWHPQPGDRAIDLGTGAGFPGLPLAIRHPDVSVVVNDSARKKVDFLQEVIDELAITNAQAVWARAEQLGRDPAYRARFNIVFARAVAQLGVLIEYALPLLKVGGMLIAMKGPQGETEAGDAGHALQQLGGTITDLHHLAIPGAGERVLVIVSKTRQTPPQYPRDAAAIKKKPL